MPKTSDLLVELCCLVRFGIVGILVISMSAVMTFIRREVVSLAAVRASFFGQRASMGLSCFGHSPFSFGHKIDLRTYLWRFVVIAFMTLSMKGVVTWFLTIAMRIYYGISAAIVGVLIPLTNYMCNRSWIFLPGLNSLQPAANRAEPRCDTDK